MLRDLVDIIANLRHLTQQFRIGRMYDFFGFAFGSLIFWPSTNWYKKVNVPNLPARVLISLNSELIRRISTHLFLIFLLGLSFFIADVREIFGIKGLPFTNIQECKETKLIVMTAYAFYN